MWCLLEALLSGDWKIYGLPDGARRQLQAGPTPSSLGSPSYSHSRALSMLLIMPGTLPLRMYVWLPLPSGLCSVRTPPVSSWLCQLPSVICCVS